MAACESTTPARPNLTPPAIIRAGVAANDDGRVPLFVKEGEVYRRAPESIVLHCARQLVWEQFRPGAPVLDDPKSIRQFLTLQLADRDHEVVALILLDAECRLIEYVELFRGTIDGASVYPRDIVARVLEKRAASVVLVHNHPSGSTEPSLGDRTVTRRVKAALELVEVKLLDHLIVGRHVVSMKSAGWLNS